MRGVEPPRAEAHRHLKPARLPVPPHPRARRIIDIMGTLVKGFGAACAWRRALGVCGWVFLASTGGVEKVSVCVRSFGLKGRQAGRSGEGCSNRFLDFVRHWRTPLGMTHRGRLCTFRNGNFAVFNSPPTNMKYTGDW
jgi:hypothetical protein